MDGSVLIHRKAGSIRAIMEEEFKLCEKGLSIVSLVVFVSLLKPNRLGSPGCLLYPGQSMLFGRVQHPFKAWSMMLLGSDRVNRVDRGSRAGYSTRNGYVLFYGPKNSVVVLKLFFKSLDDVLDSVELLGMAVLDLLDLFELYGCCLLISC